MPELLFPTDTCAGGYIVLRSTGRPAILAAICGGVDVVGDCAPDQRRQKAIAAILDAALIPIEYTNAVLDKDGGQWISVAEVEITEFGSQKAPPRPGRLILRHIPTWAPPHKASRVA